MRLSCFYREPIIPAIHDTTDLKPRYGWAATALTIFLLMTAVACNFDGYDTPERDPSFRCGDKSAMAVRNLPLTPSEKAAWHKSNLYDAATGSYYVPPELFYSSSWNGTNSLTTPPGDYHNGYEFCDRIVGPVP